MESVSGRGGTRARVLGLFEIASPPLVFVLAFELKLQSPTADQIASD